MKRNRYTQEFKQQIVQEVAEVGNAAQMARRHDLNPKMVLSVDQAVETPRLAGYICWRKESGYIHTYHRRVARHRGAE